MQLKEIRHDPALFFVGGVTHGRNLFQGFVIVQTCTDLRGDCGYSFSQLRQLIILYLTSISRVVSL